MVHWVNELLQSKIRWILKIVNPSTIFSQSDECLLLKNSINHDSNRLGIHANLVMSTMIDHDHIVKLSIRRVEEMGSGAAYCQLMDLLYPGEDNVAIIIRHDMISK